MARVIVFNGIGSVGKSSTARALQKIAEASFLHVQGDAFLEMIPPRLWGHSEGINFKQTDSPAGKSVEIQTGAGFNRVMVGMRASVAALSEAGNSCIVDDVLLTAEDQQLYRDRIQSIPLHFVGLHAPLEVLEKREKIRGDRLIGLARWQWDRVHKGISYDFELDTSKYSPMDSAQQIARALDIPLSE